MFPNFFTSNSNARLAVIGFSIGLLLLLIPVFLLQYHFGRIEGDLVRIGRLASEDFAPHQSFTPIQINSNNEKNPDVVVLGDSFSENNIWQSIFSQTTGQRTLSYHYQRIPCVETWFQSIINSPNPPKLIVLESIERNFLYHYAVYTQACDGPETRPNQVNEGFYPTEAPALNIFPIDISYLLNTAKNSIILNTQQPPFRFKQASVALLNRNTAFSHAHPNYLLYFNEDFDQEKTFTTPRNLQIATDNIRRYQQLARKKGIALAVLVIPNKSSVYAPWAEKNQLPPAIGENLFTAISTMFGASANLLPYYRQLASNTEDVYLSNDTHFSLIGFQHLSQQLIAQLKEQQYVFTTNGK